MIRPAINGEFGEPEMVTAVPSPFALRDGPQLAGTRYGYGIAACGTCTMRTGASPGSDALYVGRPGSERGHVAGRRRLQEQRLSMSLLQHLRGAAGDDGRKKVNGRRRMDSHPRWP
jgi:hypothetical protein